MRAMPPPRRGSGVGVFNAPSGPPGPMGTDGPPGPPGPAGVTPRGPWSPGNSYAARDEVTWLGSTFQALNAVAVGGSNPGIDSANWFVTRQGGGEIARAEQVASQNLGTATAGAWTDLTGLSIVVPAGAPAFLLEAFMPGLTFNGGAANVAGDTVAIGLYVRDETGALVAQGRLQHEITAASKAKVLIMSARRVMAAPTADHTYRASIYWSVSRAGQGAIVAYAGPGTATGAPGLDVGPNWIAATAR
jgi:hypothetical protein